jgi:HK97 family phage prohead protease
MKLEHKSFKARVKAEDEGILEAIVSVFGNVDQAEERVLPGFFQESLAQKMPKGVWMHDWTAPVAKTLEAREILPGDPLLPDHLKELGGLYIKGQFNLDTQRGREAFSDLKFGIVDEFSIGYRNIVTQYDEEDKVLNLVKGELYEWSPVLVGCNRETALLSAKGMTFDQQFTETLDSLDSLIGRWEGLASKRLEKQPRLSQAHQERLKTLGRRLSELEARAVAPDAPDLLAEARKAYAQIVARNIRYRSES